jgi:hypothetical protein
MTMSGSLVRDRNRDRSSTTPRLQHRYAQQLADRPTVRSISHTCACSFCPMLDQSSRLFARQLATIKELRSMPAPVVAVARGDVQRGLRRC